MASGGGGGTGGARMTLTILEQPLRIASIPNGSLRTYCHALLHSFLFARGRASDDDGEEAEPRFFSMTRSRDDVSIIANECEMLWLQRQIDEIEAELAVRFGVVDSSVDDASADNTTANTKQRTYAFDMWPQRWKAIRLDEGALGFEGVGTVHSLSAPLSDAGISVFYQSTFDTDYCLVQEDCLEQALSVLESSFAIITSADRSGTEAAPAPSSSQAGAPQRARQLVLNVLPNELQLASIRAADKHIIAMMLIEQFFTLERSSIISYTEAEETISLVIEREAFEALSARAVDGDRSILNVYNHLWAVLRVGDGTPLGYELCGVVSAISAPLASGHKSIFYLSTYRTDFCLVLADELELVQTILIADGFQVVPTHS